MLIIGEDVIVQCLDKMAILLEPSWWQIFSAISTPIIALLVGYVAYRQYRIDKSRLRQETYPVKILIYKASIKFISEIIKNSSMDEVKIARYYEEVSEANFLFGKFPNKQIEDLYYKAFDLFELETICKSYQVSPGEEITKEQSQDYSETLKKRNALKKWFVQQQIVTAKIFKKELALIEESVWRKVINKDS